MRALLAGRWLRLVAALLVLLAIWQVISYLWLQQQEPAVQDAALLSRRGARPAAAPPASAENAIDIQPVTLDVEVFYEALCPDSRTFVVEQLAPVVHAVGAIMHVVLVPYGKAKTEYQRRPDRRAGDPPPVTFTCQHGAEECWGNKVHACGIRQAESQTQAVDFATCLMKRYRKLRFIAGECASSVGLDWAKLSACADGDAIDADMERYGNMTHAVRPKIDFIPTITIDGSQAHQGEMFSRFQELICSAYQERVGAKAKNC